MRPLLGGAAACIALALLLLLYGDDPVVPAYDAARTTHCPSDARLLDRDGVVLHERRVDATRRRLAWTPLADIPPVLVRAVIASEDRRFAAHRGVDWHAAAAAAWQRLRGGPPRGASTITMQLAALLDPALARGSTPRTLAAKWRQMRAARALELTWTKDEILTAYLNLVSFRGELQGVRAAAEHLFGKAPHGLTTAEALTLAALIRGPNAGHAVLADRVARLDAALGGLAGDGARAEAIAHVLDAPARAPARVALAPHVARRVLDESTACADAPSTLAAAAQRAALDAVARHLTALRDRGVRDAAVLAVDNASGAVLAYVGSSGALSPAAQVDGVHARRQAGSTLKPFLYGLALEQRLLTAATRLDDTPLELAVAGGLFRPRNYDDVFHGPVSVRTALAGSRNVPAVRALGLVGVEPFAARLRALGFAGVREPGGYYGPSLALGAADVTLWELVGAYRALATGGLWSPLHLRPDAPTTAPRRVLDAGAAFIVADMLADREARAASFGLEGPLSARRWAAVKTGTSTDMRDNWCVGFTPAVTVGVWVGNFAGAPMREVSGLSGAAPIWLDVITALSGAAAPAPTPPPGLERHAGEWFLAGTAPRADGVRPAAAPAIVAPVDGTIIALDPDLGAERQRIALEATGAADLRWEVDGVDLGAAAQLALLAPTRGRHTIALVDDGGRAAATSHIIVR